MNQVTLFIHDDDDHHRDFSSAISICRICHEEEFESCKALEVPCACSGTVKFAHRDCVQRWCDEKGNTVCEICLQKFEPGYTSPPKKTQLIATTITIRETLVVPINEEEGNQGEILDRDYYSEYATADNTGAACWRSVALIFTALLLIRHLFDVLTGEEGPYPFSLATVLMAKASGILLPMYILIRVVAALHSTISLHYQNSDNDTNSDDDDEDEDEDGRGRHSIETQV
ncbi:uncharacterized protein LOC127243114 [Andrographis paniculata]|uniref:uncharacterized protein LOC127243114 n=1 Tax=Andrographis paniculata TaxID=175694 RepID=UPI0021E805B7|nr:uncharacterized protein LOC127243114 [Andrographis paniculata]